MFALWKSRRPEESDSSAVTAPSAAMTTAWWGSLNLRRWQEADGQILNKLYPDNKAVPKGDPSIREKLNGEAAIHDGSKCAKMLNVKYNSLENCVKDMAESLKSRFDI
jgi:hypothetical protein